MRFSGFLFRLFVLTVLVVALAANPGTAAIAWRDFEIKTSAAFLLFVLFLLSLVLFTLYRFVHFLRHGPRFWRMRRKLRHLGEGQDMFTKGLIAIAAGDGVEAGRLAVASRKLLGATPATRLLQAQAAQLAGDERTARVLFLGLAADPETMVLGYRGLIGQAVRAGNWDDAERFLEKLAHLKPETPWLSRVRFDLAVRRCDWLEAQGYVKPLSSPSLGEAALSPEHKAAIFLALAEEKQKGGDIKGALEESERACKAAPAFFPAIYALAKIQNEADYDKLSVRTIEKAWEAHAHPQLAALYTKIKDEKNPIEAFKNIERLTKKNRENPVSQFILAEAALAADLWGEARRFLLALSARGGATQGVYRLLAALEQKEKADGRAAHLWMTKALDASPDARWLCSDCGAEVPFWKPSCPACGAFKTFAWKVPGVAAPKGARVSQILRLEDGAV